ncbi:ATP-binding cassette domain-containing protein (plasmid) [Candidatus Bandiella numerosa]|uniref:ATP-binding cassette domain-containing protein n=1 Tax=Candidatus Bandiella numerosa TaxID=2570586 RepID=UPI00249F6168|nr:ATP-binding cassette domain-containing protein [Candidatus Bandiella numerosa]WHA05726.1 ATP-binding cassette domain-containing protein [Candidatus Bandiella numerosa]
MQVKNKKISIYDIINNYDFLFTPIANAASGAIGFGLPGSLAGIVIGTIDESLISLGYTNSRYLSPIIQGISSFATLSTSWVIRGIGGVLNLMLFKLTISEYSEYANKISNPVQLGLYGSCVYGWKGGIGAILFGSIEEIFIHYKLYNKYYISTAVSFATGTRLLKGKIVGLSSNFIINKLKLEKVSVLFKNLEEGMPYLLESISVVISSIKIMYDEDQKSNVNALNIQKEIKIMHVRLGQELAYTDMLEKQIITASGFAIVEQFLHFKLMGYFQKYNGAFYGELVDSQIWESFKLSLKDIFLMLPSLIIIKQFLINPFDAYFSFQFQNQLCNIISNKWIIGEIPLKLLQQDNSEVLIDNLNKDIAIVANNGEGLRKSFFNDIIKSSYSQYLMYQYNAQDLIIIYQIYYSCTQYISENLSKWEVIYSNILRDFESRKNSILKHDARNVETVVERNGFIYSKEILKILNNDIKLITTKQLLVKHLYDTWKEVELYTNIMFTFFSIGYKAHIGELHLDGRLKIAAATESISSLMSWRGKNAKKIEEVNNSIKNLNSFIDKIEYVEDTTFTSLNQIGDINHGLVFKDLNLSIGNNELIYIKEINLKLGAYYALTGNSGSGKSSLLSKIKGIKYDGIKASGVIEYPHNLDKVNEIILMSQKDFFPLDTTLLEAIYYPQLIKVQENKEIYYKVLKMLQKLDLCNSNNIEKEKCDIENFMNVKKDWNYVLSGGQKKKVLLVSALMQSPKILLLDEPFTGLHQKAIFEMQSLIKETLESSNALVICIDHHVNDSMNFYDFELSIKNNTLELKTFEINDMGHDF